jgi:hypothetical protein
VVELSAQRGGYAKAHVVAACMTWRGRRVRARAAGGPLPACHHLRRRPWPGPARLTRSRGHVFLTRSRAGCRDDLHHALSDKDFPSLKSQQEPCHGLSEADTAEASLQQHGLYGFVPSPLPRLFCAPHFGLNSIAQDACHRLVQPSLV